MNKNKSLLDKYDLSCVNTIWTGAAPLGAETADDVNKLWPHWLVRQGYGSPYEMKNVTLTRLTHNRYDGVMHLRVLYSLQ